MMMVILRLSSTHFKEIRNQAGHNVCLCQEMALLYCTTYVIRREVFENHVTVKKGHTLLSSVYVTNVTRVVVCIQETLRKAGLSCY
jgi:hypothetical protein